MSVFNLADCGAFTGKLHLTTVAKNPWLALRRPNLRTRVRLFCLPYAGGSETIFRTWQQNLPETIEVLPIQLPGRGARMKEPPLTRLPPLVQALSRSLRPEMNLPFAFFGHSMGGMIAFELARRQDAVRNRSMISIRTKLPMRNSSRDCGIMKVLQQKCLKMLS
jgi:surfactin synthase thioesterase subunit